MRKSFLPSILLILSLAFRLTAQETPAGQSVGREELEDNIKRLTARVEDIEKSLQSQQKTISQLSAENDKLRSELSKVASKDSSGSLKQLAEAIQKVDEARIADNTKILATIETLRAALLSRTPPKGTGTGQGSTPPPPGTNGNNGTGTGYEYIIKSGDTLSAILARLKKQNIKVTEKQMREANPGVIWEKLKIDQKIFIPATLSASPAAH